MKAALAAVLLLLLLWSSSRASAAPLHTQSRWIVDENGRRVKLACVNWPSHLETMLAEGLGKEPVGSISKRVLSMGFNCVRFTWPLFMVTNETMGNITVRENFQRLGLNESIAGIEVNNYDLIDLPVIKAYQAVVSAMSRSNLMVILDNHISKPGWCCANTDGNGFFGDMYFDPDDWVKGLARMATMFNGSTNVIGMSLRNELRGPRQTVSDWYKYMTRGAEAVHAANPNVLVILSGLRYDNDLGFLHSKMVNVTFADKLVFEVHWYSFSDGIVWLDENANDVCGRIAGNVMRKAGFLLEKGWPLFLSEFGVDQRGGSVADNRYLSCALGVLAELDMDWALWALQGSYYLRQGRMELDESFGVLNWDWCGTRNASFLQRINAVQLPFQGPGFSQAPPHNLLFHPATGLCVVKRYLLDPPHLGHCSESQQWIYTSQSTITLRNSPFCLIASGAGRSPMLGRFCGGSNAKWALASASKMHLSSQLLRDGGTLCLDVGANGTIVTNPCKCLSGSKTCEPDSQWFKIVNSTRSIVRGNDMSSSSQNGNREYYVPKHTYIQH